MAQTINTNLASITAARSLTASQGSMSTSMQRLSSGLRINNAKDDAAGLAIADRMNAQIRGMSVAMRNANDAISLAQTAEGGIANLGDALQRMRELAVQSANATNKPADRENLNAEFQLLIDEVERLVDGSKFNGQTVLNNNSAWVFQIGPDSDPTSQLTLNNTDLTTSVKAAVNTLTIATTVPAPPVDDGADNAAQALGAIDGALDAVVAARAQWGAIQNRIDSVVSQLAVTVENLTAARGRIMDADFAVETANLSRAQILQQAGTAMLAQANAQPQNVLKLLQG